jgi:hypothetical protein
VFTKHRQGGERRGGREEKEREREKEKEKEGERRDHRINFDRDFVEDDSKVIIRE